MNFSRVKLFLMSKADSKEDDLLESSTRNFCFSFENVLKLAFNYSKNKVYETELMISHFCFQSLRLLHGSFENRLHLCIFKLRAVKKFYNHFRLKEEAQRNFKLLSRVLKKRSKKVIY